MTHALLDTLPQSHALRYLRALLVDVGALPARHDPLERATLWVHQRFTDVPRAHARLARPFADWTLLRRARRRAARGQFTEGSGRYLRQRVNVALHFLAWLDDHQRPPEALTQADVDLYLASGSTRRFIVRDFLAWAIDRGAVPAVKVPLRRQLSTTEAFDTDERWTHLNRLLHDDTIPIAARAAGSLVLTYGQHLSRVVTWPADRVTLHPDGSISLRFDTAEIELPAVIGELFTELLDTQPARLRPGRRPTQPVWLFPGATPGRHVNQEHLRQLLANEGITLRQARNTALSELATDLPAPVLASLLGLHINTAVSWVKSMQRDWTDFVAISART